MKDVLIKNGRIIDPATGLDEIGDVLLSNGLIKKLGQNIADSDTDVIDATSKVVCPGFIDLHCHLRQPGYEAKETISSGSRAAAKGGFTTICCMPNTNPPLDNAPLVTYVNTITEKEAVIRILPIGCITRARKGEELADMMAMAQSGVVGFSDDGSYVKNPQLLRHAMEYSLPLGLPIIAHCEDPDLAADGQMNEGIVATALGLSGIPSAAEETAIARDIILAELTGARLHIAHVSTKGAVELVRQGKRRGVKVTAEVTPHHLTLTEECLLGYNTQAKVSPPLRTQADIDALIDGLKDGTLDVIATDHAPHTTNDKQCEFGLAACGISGLETAFASLMELVHTGKLTLPLLISKMTSKPAAILRMKLGSLATGAPADIAIFDQHKEWTVASARFVSKGHNTPLEGKLLKGKVTATIYVGQVVYHSKD
jgi:dihydroorotase